MPNFNAINTFEGGYSKDLANNIEKKNTFSKGVNGRIYEKDGVFYFTGIPGSRLVYQNSSIVKYIGYHSFRDETLVFAKCTKPTGAGQGTEQEVCEQVLTAESFTVTDVTDDEEVLFFTEQISNSTTQSESCYTITKPIVDETNFDINYSDIEEEVDVIDFAEYYNERFNVANFKICDLNLNQVPVNNLEYYDTIISFTQDSDGNFKGIRIWTGAQNWPLNGKITTEGVEENEYYKRVYYSDAVNPRRVFNRKDKSLLTRTAKEFSQILDNVLLQPEVESITDGGQIPSMRVQYLYRIISENGQVSGFSPFSFFADILPENESIKYRGGDIGEATGKLVNIKCNIIDPEPSSEIECIALEYQADGPPTAIRNLGIKPAKSVVKFKHFGNETEFGDQITIQDILEFKNTWLYCNDFTSKKNKLIAAGLRNKPTPTAINNLDYLFPLHSWASDGSTHETLMNPEPWKYRYIDPTNTTDLIFIKQKKYSYIGSFGPAIVSFKNKITSAAINLALVDLSLEEYTDVTQRVIDWLVSESNEDYFTAIFPNLKIIDYNGQLLMSPVDDQVETDFSNYVFESNNEQFIETFQNDLVFTDPGVNQSKFVHGAESIGFNQGNGVRVSYREIKEPLLKQATEVYNGSGKILDYYTPSGEKYFMKGEIYRLAFQAYDKSSNRYFSIPLGDIMIPELGDLKSSIDDQGNPIITSTKYLNQSVENGILYGHGIKMHVEVRLDCEMQKLVSMYQLLYVERTEENRTILCQGISAPLYRLQFDGNDDHRMPDDVLAKWVLPYYGGPVYDKRGLRSYDEQGENWNYEGDGSEGSGNEYKKLMTSRKLMYFDSPDLYYGKISDQYFKTSKINVVAKLNTDHTPYTIMERGGFNGFRPEKYPKFSRKITEEYLEGDIHVENLPRRAIEDRESGTHESYFINISVFAKYQNIDKNSFDLQHAESLNRGEVMSGAPFGLDHDISNNAMAAPCMPWFFSQYQMRSDRQDNRSRADMFREITVSPGYPTIFMKTTQDLFTQSFIGPDYHSVDTEIRLGGGPHTVYDTYPLINIFKNNRESVYGGRTRQAYSRNTFIPHSKTLPVSKNSGVQSFDVGADTYVTLNIRTKNDAGDTEIKEIEFDNGGRGRAKGEIDTYRRNGAWNYVCVLETQVEPKLDYGYYFYRETGTYRFDVLRREIINGCYLNTNNLKEYIPKPFKFKDDPDMGNVIAVSNVKLAGELYDSWTMFKPNNFYAELEKNRGDVSNIFRFNEQIFAIQEDQISMIYIGTDRIITDAEGQPINIKQGSGTVVDGHKILNSYGTSIRRAIALSEHGYCFFDEKKIEFIKNAKPMLITKLLQHDYWDLCKTNPIIDTEGFYDHLKKESNIRLRLDSGKSFVLSYNEALQVFNGEYEMDNDIYINFNHNLFAPITIKNPDQTILSKDLHQLNEGDYLNLFNQQKTVRIGVTVNADIDKIIQCSQVLMVSSLNYPVKSVYFKTSRGEERTVYGTHPWYKIREGNHTVPAKNETNNRAELGDLRGNWVYVEVEMESLNKNKVDILAVINSLRFSHQ